MIREVSRAEIEPFVKQAMREHCIFNTKTTYYGYFENEELCGFAGIMYYRTKAIFQSDFVRPEFRGRGIYNKLIQFRLNLLRGIGYKTVEVNCLATSLHANLKAGAKIVKEFKICTQLRYDL